MSEDAQRPPEFTRTHGAWHVWWRARAGYGRASASGRFIVHDQMEELVGELAACPRDPLAFHESTRPEIAEEVLQAARLRGWEGPWAAPADWLQRHRWLRHTHGPALEIGSWPEFWLEPWAAVGRSRPLTDGQREACARWTQDGLPVPIAVVWEGAVASTNRSFQQLLGMAPEELHGLAFSRLWAAPRESYGAAEILRHRPLGGREHTLDAHWRRPDQRELRVELRCRPVEDDALVPDAWVIAAHDVSQHHRTREFLTIQRNLVECAQDGIAVVDLSEDGGQRLIFVNAAWERMCGYSAEEALGRHPGFLQGEDRDQPGAEILRRAVSRRESANTVLRNYRKDGGCFYTDVTIFPLTGTGDSESLQYVGIKRDVTDRIETELRLAESERRFRHLFSDNRLPMLLLDAADGSVLDANPAAIRFYGYSRHAFTRLHLEDLWVGFTKDAAPDALPPLSQTHRLANGSDREVLFYAGDLQTGEGRMRYAIVVDVTQQHRTELQLRAAMEAAEAANVAKSEFLQVVGHEIRTPMNAILGFAELLADAREEDEREESVRMIMQGTRELVEVLDSVVEYISWDAEHAVADDVEVNLGEFASEIVGDWRERAEEKGLELHVTHPRDATPVWVPLAGYSRILNLVLDNAIKFTATGRISFDLAFHPRSCVLVARVTDTGVGISPELLQRLFTPFCSGDGSIDRTHGGIGLGLARAQRMVAAFGGSIRVESRVGEGSTFTVEMPFRTASPSLDSAHL